MNKKFEEDIKFDERGLVPAIVQEEGTGRVLMLAYMNAESLGMSIETGFTHFWSRSRQKLWKKGETSGHLQKIRDIFYDCDLDTLLVTVEQTGPACHTGMKSCFYRMVGVPGEAENIPAGNMDQAGNILDDLQRVIADRKTNPKEGSYVSSLFGDGKDKMRAKVMEESREVVEASAEEDRDQVLYEAADLLFHMMVLLEAHDLGIDPVRQELTRRFGNPPKKDQGTKKAG